MITENTQREELYYEVVGAGEPLLLVHGAAAAGSQFKQNDFHAELSSRFRVITLDLTGLGHSSRVASVRPAQWCDDVVNVLDAAGADRAHLYGVSLGARVAGRVALDYPARVISLTVDAPITRSTAGNARLSDRFSRPEEASPQQAETWRSMHGDDWAEVIKFYGRSRSDAELQDHLTLFPRLGEIIAPTLICHGDTDDSVQPLDQALEWYRASAQPWLWVAPGCASSMVWRHFPAELAELMVRFAGQKGATNSA